MIHVFSGSFYGSNCYLIVGDKVALVDAGLDASLLLEWIHSLHVGVDYLINTHCHFDHVGGDFMVLNKTGAKLCVHESGVYLLEAGDSGKTLAGWFAGKMQKLKVDVRLRDGQVLDLGDVVLEVLHTPGHSPESICLYEPKSKSLFCGDTVFADGVGRTDLFGGSASELRKSIKRLINLRDERGINEVYPGHGPSFSGCDLESYESILGEE